MKFAVKMYMDEISNKFKTRTTRIISLKITSHCLFDFVVSIDWLQSKTLICLGGKSTFAFSVIFVLISFFFLLFYVT